MLKELGVMISSQFQGGHIILSYIPLSEVVTRLGEKSQSA